jgi:hypothetical protein
MRIAGIFTIRFERSIGRRNTVEDIEFDISKKHNAHSNRSNQHPGIQFFHPSQLFILVTAAIVVSIRDKAHNLRFSRRCF